MSKIEEYPEIYILDNIVEFKKALRLHLDNYYKNNDKAHGWSHIDEVLNLALKMNNDLELNISEFDILTAVYCHDMFTVIDRDNHHTLAKEYIINELPNRFKVRLSDVEMVAKASGEHRASFKGMFSSMLSELVSSADRGIPNLKTIIYRIHVCAVDPSLNFAYDLENPKEFKINDTSLKDIINKILKEDKDNSIIKAKVLGHLVDKYSRGGYAKYSLMYLKYFEKDINDMWDRIDYIAQYPDVLENFLVKDL